jgi:hypothetical protein
VARGERALVVYHNRYKEARGWVRTSVRCLDGGGRLTQKTLAEGLDLPREAPPGGRDLFLVFRDAVTNLEYLRECRELLERGLYLELGAFKYHVFWDLRVVASSASSPYRALAGELAGQGVPSIDDALARRVRQPIHASLYEAIGPGSVRYLADAWDAEEEAPTAGATRALHRKLADIEDGLRHAFGALDDAAAAHAALESRYVRILVSAARPRSAADRGVAASPPPDEGAFVESVLHAWLFVAAVEDVRILVPHDARPASAFDGWDLESVVARALTEAGHDAVRVQLGISLLRRLASGAVADDADALTRSICARLLDETRGDAPGEVKQSTPDVGAERTSIDPPEQRPAGSP